MYGRQVGILARHTPALGRFPSNRSRPLSVTTRALESIRQSGGRMHISNGDSTASGGAEKPAKTFSLQDSLPRLPIPDLEKSLEGYVKSLTPLLEQKVSQVTI